MNIGSDILETIAILDDSAYLRGARRMAQATESIGENKGWLRLASASTLVGGGLVGLGVKAVQTAAQFQQMRQSFETLYGSMKGGQLFDQLKQFTFTTPYTTSQLADDVRLLGNMGVAADKSLPMMKDLGDAVTAGFGVNPEKLRQATYALAEMNAQFISLRQIRMLTIAGIPAMKYLEQGLHMTPEQLSKIGNMHISGALGAQIIQKGIENDPARAGAMTKQMHSLAGEASNLSDAWQQFLAASGSPALQPVEEAIGKLSLMLQSLTSSGSSKIAGEAMLYGGPALLAGGAIMKAVAGWRQMAQAKNIARIAAVAEKDAEVAKLPVLGQEATAVAGTTGKWGIFGKVIGGAGDWLSRFAEKSGVAGIATAGLSTQIGVGAARLGLMGVAAVGLTADIYAIVGAMKALGDASSDMEASNAAVKNAQGMGYDVKGGGATGFAGLSTWKQYGEIAGNYLANIGTAGLWKPFNTDDMGTKSLIDSKWAQRHKGGAMPPGGVRAQQMAAAAEGDGGDIPDPAKSLKSKLALYDYKVGHDERTVALLKEQKASQDKINAAKLIEIGHLNTISNIYLQQARAATDPDARYKLLGQSEEAAQKAALLKVADPADKKSAMDKMITQIISATGVSDTDAVHMGVNRRMLSQYGAQGKVASVTAAAKRPMVVNIILKNKVVDVMKQEITDQIYAELLSLMQGSHGASQLSVK